MKNLLIIAFLFFCTVAFSQKNIVINNNAGEVTFEEQTSNAEQIYTVEEAKGIALQKLVLIYNNIAEKEQEIANLRNAEAFLRGQYNSAFSENALDSLKARFAPAIVGTTWEIKVGNGATIPNCTITYSGNTVTFNDGSNTGTLLPVSPKLVQISGYFGAVVNLHLEGSTKEILYKGYYNNQIIRLSKLK